MNNSIKHVVVDMEKFQPIKSPTGLWEKIEMWKADWYRRQMQNNDKFNSK